MAIEHGKKDVARTAIGSHGMYDIPTAKKTSERIVESMELHI